MPPDGGGRGHFRTVGEMREAVARHEADIAELKRDVIDLTILVLDKPKRRRRRRRRAKGE